MALHFKPLEKEDKPILDAFFRADYYENSHFNFTNFFMWREPYHIEWAVESGILYMKGTWGGKDFAMQPFCPKERWNEAIAAWLSYFEEHGKVFRMQGIEKRMAEALDAYPDAEFEVMADRDSFDYVYEAASLITLSGRKYHSKKNHLNSFRKAYPEAEYRPICEDIVMRIKLNLNAWNKHRASEHPDDPFIPLERQAILEVLNNFSDFKLKGGAILLDNRVVAFTFGEQLNSDTAVIHVEKADPDVRGAYPAINQGFVEHAWSDMTYINREEDMGIEGLRKAKESYKPVKLIEKYNAVLKK
ncbi:DUF2156 domain-containing protein [Selenomonas sp. TAMA-11512]|uniref:DUF2156 domain-containing protein n=1 Tax=Selenomonas sp. TAMA-11512 TaxID=3095337 RepID=UPI00309341D4|nr:DUF2156 domain-containing protein [Selenomonas sp. TAMA-11512]